MQVLFRTCKFLQSNSNGFYKLNDGPVTYCKGAVPCDPQSCRLRWEGLSRGHLFSLMSKQDQAWLLRTIFTWGFKTSKDYIAFLGNLFLGFFFYFYPV